MPHLVLHLEQKLLLKNITQIEVISTNQYDEIISDIQIKKRRIFEDEKRGKPNTDIPNINIKTVINATFSDNLATNEVINLLYNTHVIKEKGVVFWFAKKPLITDQDLPPNPVCAAGNSG